MLDIKSGKWIEITFVEGYEPKCSLGNILYGIMLVFLNKISILNYLIQLFKTFIQKLT